MSTRTAEKDKPMKPLTAYFRYRVKRLAEIPKEEKNRSKKIQVEWGDMSTKEKEKYER